MKRLLPASAILLLGMALPVALHADTENEARLKDQLRQTILQLRQLQDQNSELLAKAASAPAARPAESAKPSKAELDRVRGAARQEMKQELAAVQAQLDDARAQVATLQQQLADAGAQLNAARTAAAAGAAAEKQLPDVRHRLDTCQKDNRELADIGAELLQRYHDMGVWQALWQAEPLVGVGRVRREKLVEKYRGAIVDASVAPPVAASAASAPAGGQSEAAADRAE